MINQLKAAVTCMNQVADCAKVLTSPDDKVNIKNNLAEMNKAIADVQRHLAELQLSVMQVAQEKEDLHMTIRELKEKIK